MLEQMRSLTRNWISRILLGVIALAMAITLFQGDFVRGITGMFSPPGVAQVGPRTITERDLQRELDTLLRQVQARGGQSLSRADAIHAGLHLRALESLIQRRAAQEYARRLGIHVSDAQLAEQIRQFPQVRNELTGRFDPQAFESFVREIGYQPREFEEELRDSMAADELLRAMTSGVRAPSSYGKLILAFRSERRVVSVAEIDAGHVGQIPAPTTAQLQDFYNDNRQAFAVPEFRTATIVFARTSEFADRVQITDERLRQEYEQRRASLTQPEKRSFVQISAPNEAKARDAAARLSRGEDPTAVAHALGLQTVRMADKTAAEVGDPGVRQAIFAMTPGAPAQAVQGQLTPWVAVRLESVTAAVTPDFATQREQIRHDIATQEGGQAMEAALDAFETARDSGTSIADAARAQGLSVVTVPAVTAEGRGENGQPVAELLDTPDLVHTIFQTQEGETTEFMPVGDGAYALLQVDRVIAATTRPFEQVRQILAPQWIARERARRLQEAASQVNAAVGRGQTFEAAVRAAGGRLLARSQTVARPSEDDQHAQTDQQFLQLVFSAQRGQVANAVRRDAGAVLLVNVEEIQRADPGANAQMVDSFSRRMDGELAETLGLTIQAAAVTDAHVRRNEDRITQLFATEQGNQEAQ